MLGTGASWKDQIDSIYLSLPPGLKPFYIPGNFVYAGHHRSWGELYHATQYEPKAFDEVTVKLSWLDPHMAPYYPGLLSKTKKVSPKTPNQGFITNIQSSSHLAGSTQIYFHDPWGGDRWMGGKTASMDQIYRSNFTPMSAFDGLAPSAWCEGVEGAGIGEWLQFELQDNIRGMQIYSGFSKVSDKFNWNSPQKKPCPFTLNNRPREIELVSSKGQVVTSIKLQDTPKPQMFRQVALKKGKYLLRIVSVYPGKKYSDTCIGEVSFFLADPFLQKTLGKL